MGWIDNDRWSGVPFVMRAGKGLDERMAEVRVTFKQKAFNNLVPGQANELVMRIQPDEAIFFKCMNKVPGWQQNLAAPVVLDMSYSNSFPGSYVADAYERMFLNASTGNRSLFVGSQELVEAWRIFTPLLHEIEESRPEPVIYPFGSRVPPGMDEWATKYGIELHRNWKESLLRVGESEGTIRKLFDEADSNHDGKIDASELKQLAYAFFEGREPSDVEVGRILGRLDANADGTLDFDEVQQGVAHLACNCVHEHRRDHSQWEGETDDTKKHSLI